mmetsp:Transcript_58939/g.164690  ORF Transcript_58939/g.164690 Transcript_58939/m.164690 type:complete len:240 (-) Transcript_58939:472-1191(-)
MGIMDTTLQPRCFTCSRRAAAALNVPSLVKLPTCSSYNTSSRSLQRTKSADLTDGARLEVLHTSGPGGAVTVLRFAASPFASDNRPPLSTGLLTSANAYGSMRQSLRLTRKSMAISPSGTKSLTSPIQTTGTSSPSADSNCSALWNLIVRGEPSATLPSTASTWTLGATTKVSRAPCASVAKQATSSAISAMSAPLSCRLKRTTCVSTGTLQAAAVPSSEGPALLSTVTPPMADASEQG